MKEINCSIIRDILPLYVDEVVSADTKELVEEHLAECEACRRWEQTMRQPVNLPVAEGLQREEAEAFKKLKKTLRNRKFRVSVISALLTVVVLAGAYCALIIPSRCIPYDPQHIKVYEENGVVYAEYEGIEIAGWNYTQLESSEYKGKTHQIFYLEENGWSKFIQPMLNRINPPDESERRSVIGNADEIQAVYYGEFSTVGKTFSTKTPEEQVAESQKQIEEIVKTEPVWGE